MNSWRGVTWLTIRTRNHSSRAEYGLVRFKLCVANFRLHVSHQEWESDIQFFDVQGMFLNELPPRFYVVAH